MAGSITVSQNEEAEKKEEIVATPSVDANACLTVEPHKKAILVKGDTKEVKDQLKALKGSWNKTLEGWIFKGSDKEEVQYLLLYRYVLPQTLTLCVVVVIRQVIALLRADPTNVVEEVENSSPPAKKAKREKDFIDDDDY
jgi:hypothetical protein